MDIIETIEVVIDGHPDGLVRINKEAFNPDVHKMPEEKKTARKKRRKSNQ